VQLRGDWRAAGGEGKAGDGYDGGGERAAEGGGTSIREAAEYVMRNTIIVAGAASAASAGSSAAGGAGAAPANESNDSEYYVNDTRKKWSKRPGSSEYMNISTGMIGTPVNPVRLTDAMMETVDDSEYYLNAAGKHWSKELGSNTYMNLMNSMKPGSPTLPVTRLTEADMDAAKRRAEAYAHDVYMEDMAATGDQRRPDYSSIYPALNATGQIYLRDASKQYDTRRESFARRRALQYEKDVSLHAMMNMPPPRVPDVPDEMAQKYLKSESRAKLGLPPLSANPNARRATRKRKSRRSRSRKVRK
jgi:hypothetical protein